MSGRVQSLKGASGPARVSGSPVGKSGRSLLGRILKSGKAPAARAATGGKVRTDKLNSGFREAAEYLGKRTPAPGSAKTDRWLIGFVETVEKALRQPGAYCADDGSSLKDPAELVGRLIDEAVAAARPEDRAALRGKLEGLRASGQLAAALELAEARRGGLEARIKENHAAFERTFDPLALKLENLPASLRQSPEFAALMKDFAKAMAKGGEKGSNAVLALAPRFNELYSKLAITDRFGNSRPDTSTQLLLSITDGKALLRSFTAEAMKGASLIERRAMRSTLREMEKGPAASFHHTSALNLGGSLSGDGATLVIDGKTYHRVGNAPLGSGSFGEVWHYKMNPADPNERGLALKEPLGGDVVDGPAEEARALVNVLGTGTAVGNVAEMVTTFRSGDKVYTAMPMLTYGSFAAQLQKLDRDATLDPVDKANAKLTPFADLAQGLQRLHAAKGQVHSDIAARNVLIDDKGVGKAADFGLAKFLNGKGGKEDARTKPPGSTFPVRWSPPECFENKPLSAKADTWMLGMTLWEVVYGERPLSPRTADEARALIPVFDPKNPAHLPEIDAAKWPGGMAEKLRGLFEMMLQTDPEKRPSVEDVLKRIAADFPDVGTPETRAKLVDALGRRPETPAVPAASGTEEILYLGGETEGGEGAPPAFEEPVYIGVSFEAPVYLGSTTERVPANPPPPVQPEAPEYLK